MKILTTTLFLVFINVITFGKNIMDEENPGKKHESSKPETKLIIFQPHEIEDRSIDLLRTLDIENSFSYQGRNLGLEGLKIEVFNSQKAKSTSKISDENNPIFKIGNFKSFQKKDQNNICCFQCPEFRPCE